MRGGIPAVPASVWIAAGPRSTATDSSGSGPVLAAGVRLSAVPPTTELRRRTIGTCRSAVNRPGRLDGSWRPSADSGDRQFPGISPRRPRELGEATGSRAPEERASARLRCRFTAGRCLPLCAWMWSLLRVASQVRAMRASGGFVAKSPWQRMSLKDLRHDLRLQCRTSMLNLRPRPLWPRRLWQLTQCANRRRRSRPVSGRVGAHSGPVLNASKPASECTGRSTASSASARACSCCGVRAGPR